MVVALHVDYDQIKSWAEAVENAEQVPEEVGAPVVNVDANFVIPAELRHRDGAFPRLFQMHDIVEKLEKEGRLVTRSMSEIMLNERPFRRPDFEEEWRALKTAWSLYRRGKDHLLSDRLSAASEQFYKSEKLDDVPDWVFRFLVSMSGSEYGKLWKNVADKMEPLIRPNLFSDFLKHYAKTVDERSERYFSIAKSYFDKYPDFGQVHFYAGRGDDLPEDSHVTSNNFDATKMFYGDCFEIFSSSVDILAMFSNMLAGRPFDKFERLELKDYLRLDKAGRFAAVEAVPEFAALCVEHDNKLRNASHHGGTKFDATSQMVRYRQGKGGSGEEQKISYSEYLLRSSRIFLQTMTLLRYELLMCNVTGMRPPL
ncbi:hypothetical protein NKH34_09215 [Mesorhizobium sp. M1148]|uniref:hypothetical protein n=1 Tax=unclassified Mesorhizobium TaxID=325217 RepID=UPI0033378A3F